MTTRHEEEFWYVLQRILQTGNEWILESIEFDDVQQEVAIQISFKSACIPRCPVCQDSVRHPIPSSDRKKGYYSFLGYKTYIHSPDIFVECPKHGMQCIEKPWEEKINRRFI